MAKWSVNLRGLPNPIPDQNIDPVEYAVAIKRTQPGDIISFKPWTGGVQWVPNIIRQYLIITVDGPTREQMDALVEPYYDTTSYHGYSLKSMPDWVADVLAMIQGLPPQERGKKLQEWNDTPQDKKDKLYEMYARGYKFSRSFPSKKVKKRRFNISESDLLVKGVDLARMKNPNDIYDPRPEFVVTDIFDKVKSRKAQVTDGLRPIKPLTDAELELLPPEETPIGVIPPLKPHPRFEW